MTAQQHILILSSNTGGGHRSAAQALENSFISVDPERILVKITQVLEESTLISRKMADLYNFLLREHQDWMKHYYWLINKMRPNESRLLFDSAWGYGRRVFDRYCPQALVSVHPMTQHFFAYILRKLNLLGRIPFVTVVTDPCAGFWQGWACPDVDHYFVASEDAKYQLIDYGVGSHKITVAGMPVHTKFQPPTWDEKAAIRQSLDLDPDKFTLFVNAGWVGGGNVPKIYEALLQRPDIENFQVVYLTGRNPKLLDEAHAIAGCLDFPVKVMGCTPEMERLMAASDAMVTKLGGLTTFEALACRLPIIGDAVTPPMPQEAQTARYVEKTGTGLLLRDPNEIVSVIESLKDTPGRLDAMRKNTVRYGHLGASDRIVQDVLSLLRYNQSQTRTLQAVN